ncbi:MAG: LPS export ABC transporter periplasmic protein LptC [Pseudomonadota bacterium]
MSPHQPIRRGLAGASRAGRPGRRLWRMMAVAERRRHSLAYSRIVALMKLLLPTTALTLAGLVLLWPQFNPADSRFRLKSVALGVEDLENLRMLSPRFLGLDKHSQPFMVTAEQALQAHINSERTELVRPKADIALANGTWLALTAEQGVYRKPLQTLELSGKVSLFHDAGYEIVTGRALVDLAKGLAEGDAAVEGQGPGSRLEGEGFRILDKGARIVLTGQARVVLYPSPPEPK